MDRNAKKVLNHLIKTPNHSCVYESSFDHLGGTTIGKLSEQTKIPREEVLRTLSFLERRGYARQLKGLPAGYILTHEGIHYRYFDFEEACQFIFRSILVPIFVSAITAIVVSLLSRL